MPYSDFFLNHRILITGITGIHGWPVYRSLKKMLPSGRLYGIGPPGMRHPPVEPFVEACCITDKMRLKAIRDAFNPTIIIHAAGVCDLDVCEERPQWADRINRTGTTAVADVFSETAYILYLSTDLVFSGNNPPPEGYHEDVTPDPVSVAGKTFVAGEAALSACEKAAIIRLGLPMGQSVTGTKGGLDWIEGRFRNRRPVTLFHDKHRSVICCNDLARCIIEFLTHQKTGLFHLGGPEPVTLHQLGKKIIAGGRYSSRLLKGIMRHEEKNGPPRIGNVRLDSRKIARFLSSPPAGWEYHENNDPTELLNE